MRMLKLIKLVNVVLRVMGLITIFFASNAYADFLGNTTNPPSYEDFSSWGGEAYVRREEVDSEQFGVFSGFEQTIVLPVSNAILQSITLYDLYDLSGPEFVTFTINDASFNVTRVLPYGADITPIEFDLRGLEVSQSFTLKFSALPRANSSPKGTLLLNFENGDFLPVVKNETTIDLINGASTKYFSYLDKPLLFGLYYSPTKLAVPEPKGLGMLMAGLGLVGMLYRRRKYIN